MIQENVNNLENNEIPKITPEKVEQPEISQEELLNWLYSESDNFKQETQIELYKANSIGLDHSTFENIKNETGVEQELNIINKEAEKYINETRKLVKESESLQKSPEVLHNWDGIEGLSLSDTGEDQRKKLEEMIALGQISSEEVDKIKNEIHTEFAQKFNLEQQERQKELSDFLKETSLNIGSVVTLELVHGYPAPYKIESIDKEKGDIHFKITQNVTPQALINDREASFSAGTKGTFSLSHLRNQITEHQLHESKSENLEKSEKPNIERLIQGASSLPELYEVIFSTEGIQGSSENYSSEQIWERIRAYVNNEAEETIITRTGGLRDKVKELKLQRDQNTIESKNEFKNLSYEEWRDGLPDVHLTAGSLTFRPNKESELKDIKYFVDKKGDHYVSYIEADGSKQARKLYITANNAGISQKVDPSILE